jgi:hypothetical protein
MFEFLNCPPQNKIPLALLFQEILDLKENDEAILKHLINPQTVDAIKQFSSESQATSTENIHQLFAIVESLISVTPELTGHLAYFDTFIKTSLYITLKTLSNLELLNIHTFLDVLNEPSTETLHQLLTLLLTKFTLTSANIRGINSNLRRLNTPDFPASKDVLDIFKILQKYNHFSPQMINKILNVNNLRQVIKMIQYLIGIRAIGFSIGSHYLLQVLQPELTAVYYHIFKICDSHLNNIENKQKFLLLLLNNSSLNPETLLQCLRILAANNSLSHETILKLCVHNKLTLVLECLSEINTFKPEFLNLETCAEIIKALHQFHMGTYTQLCEENSLFIIPFLKRCHSAHLFDDAVIGKTNLLKIFNYLTKPMMVNSVHNAENIFNIFLSDIEMNEHFEQVKFNLLLSSDINNKLIIEVLQILEQSNLLAYFKNQGPIPFSNEISFNLPCHFLDITKALEILNQEGLISESRFKQFWDLLNKSTTPISHAQAFIELSKHPLYFSEKRKVKVEYKDLIIKYKEPVSALDLLHILRTLASLELLTSANFKLLKENSCQVFKAVKALLEEESFTREQSHELLELIFSNADLNPYNLILGIIKLQQEQVYTEEFKAHFLARISSHCNPIDICHGLAYLYTSELSEDKMKFYSEQCFIKGFLCTHLDESPTKIKPEKLASYTKTIALYGANLFHLDNGVITPLKKLRQQTSRDIKELLARSKENWTLEEQAFMKVPVLAEIEQNLVTCTSYAKCIIELEEKRILSTWFNASFLTQVTTKMNPEKTAKALAVLNEVGLVKPEGARFVEAVTHHQEPENLAKALKFLHEDPIIPLDHPTVLDLLQHPSPDAFIQAFRLLMQTDFFQNPKFTPYYNLLKKHSKPLEYTKCLIDLNNANILIDLLRFKSFLAALEDERIIFSLFSKMLIRFSSQKLFLAKEIERIRYLIINILASYKTEDKLISMEEFLNLPLDLLVIDESFISNIARAITYEPKFNNLLPSILALLEDEYARHLKQDIFEILIKNPIYSLQVFENIKILVGNRLINGANQEILFALASKTIKTNSNTYLGLFTYLEQEEINLSDFISKICQSEGFYQFINLISSNMTLPVQVKTYLVKSLLENTINPINTHSFYTLLELLNKNDLLNDENIEKVSQIEQQTSILFDKLASNSLLTLDNFNFLINMLRILNQPEVLAAFNRISNFNGINGNQLNIIKQICIRHLQQRTNPKNDLIDYINHGILGIARPVAPINLQVTVFNTVQSTHTASVHQTVSESALRLSIRYESQSSLENIHKSFGEISAYLSTLDSCHKHDAVKRYLHSITQNHLFLEYQDPNSGVTVKQLLHLFWIAMQDMTSRIYAPEDSSEVVINSGKLLLAEAFYEAARDGNVNGDGIDDLEPRDKKPSCPPGFINKLIEKLVGVHPDATIMIMNQQIACEKLKALICDRVVRETRLKIQAKQKIGEKLDDDSINNAVGQIWPSISEEIATVFFDEFKSLFKNDKTNAHYLAYLELGEDVELSQRQLQALHRLNQEEPRKRQADEDEEASVPLTTHRKFGLYGRTTASDGAPDIHDDEFAPAP